MMLASKPFCPGGTCARMLLALVFGLLSAAPASARYLPDTSVGPEGVIDISLRGEAALLPDALGSSLDGRGFVSAALRDGQVVVCAHTGDGQIDGSFGTGGCFREAVASSLRFGQLLTGNSSYWLLLTDASDTRHFLLFRLDAQGLGDASFGAAGRREFLLTCGVSDIAPNCPELAGPASFEDSRAYNIFAETRDGKLWLLARRRSPAGAYEGVVLRIEQGGLSSARANLFDALPATWQAPTQSEFMSPIGLVAHGDGVLVKHRTTRGYVLTRIDGNVAIDRAFAASRPEALIVTGDAALPPSVVPLPAVAADDTFVWGNLGNVSPGDRYEADGRLLGPPGAPGRVLAQPASFKDASSRLWVFDGTRVGRWQNGQWDTTTFSGHGPYTLPEVPYSIALASGGATLAVTVRTRVREGSLSMLATQAAPSLLPASLATLPGMALDVEFERADIGLGNVQRSGRQADGRLVWQRIELDQTAPQPRLAAGTVPALPVTAISGVLTSNANASGQRWIVRYAGPSELEPMEFYADAVLGGQPTRRLDLASIRARMTPFIPTSGHGRFSAFDLVTAPDGSANLFVSFAVGPDTAHYTTHMAQLRWDDSMVSGTNYRPQVIWEIDFGQNVPRVDRIHRDATGGIIMVFENATLRRISPQGVWDTGFGSGGTLDLGPQGFGANTYGRRMYSSLTPDGGLWLLQTKTSSGVDGRSVFEATPIVRIDNRGAVVSRLVKSWPPASDSGALFAQMLGAGDGGLILIAKLYRTTNYHMFDSGDSRVLRFSTDGQIDTRFGLRGAEKFFLAPPSYRAWVIYALGNGNLAAINYDALKVLRYDASVAGPSGNTVPAVEYYNATLNHYFMTADEEEINYVETGGAGPGWSRTGQSFRTFATMLDAPGDARDICRFYGSPKPAGHSPNGRAGPNSHFYTFVGEECRNIYGTDRGWIYEGTRLAVFPLLAGDTCPAGQSPVYRAYNNGFEIRNGVWISNDANHRYSTSSLIMEEMARKGWTLEGPVFCAPN